MGKGMGNNSEDLLMKHLRWDLKFSELVKDVQLGRKNDFQTANIAYAKALW